MSKNLLLSSLICLSFVGLKSQSTEIDISKYTLPNVKYQALITNFNLGTINTTNYFTGPNYTNSLFSFNSSANYYLYTNSQKYQSNILLFNNTNLYFNNSTNFYKTKSHSIAETVRIQSEHRYFFASKRFIETGLDVDLGFENNNTLIKYNSDSSLETINNGLQYNLFIPIKLGFGRIERVEDARQAYLIVKELEKVNPEMKSTDNEQILRFAGKISEIRNKRVLDYRIRKMYEIEELDSFLTAENLLPQKSGLIYSHLLDMWAYGALQPRLNGHTFTIGAIGGYANYSQNNLSNNLTSYKSNSYYKSLNFEIKYQNEKPINLKWQNSFVAKANVNYLDIDYYNLNQAVDTLLTIPMLGLNIDHYVGYYPNTRTSLIFGYNLFYTHLRNLYDTKMDLSGNYFSASIYANFQYYISPEISLFVNGRLNLLSYKMDNQINLNSSNLGNSNFENLGNPFFSVMQKNTNSSFKIGLNYTIF